MAAVLGLLVAVKLPDSSNNAVGSYLAYLLLHTAAILIVGAGLSGAKRFLAISRGITLTLFFVVAIVI